MLICTGVRAGGGPYRYSGANSALAVDRNKSATAALAMGFNISAATVISGASIANTSGIPSGVRHPQAWVLPVKGGGIKSYKRTDILIDGAAVGELGFARSGATTITIDASAAGGLIVGATGTATISIDGSAVIVGSITGSGTATIAIDAAAVIGAIASLTGSATLTIDGHSAIMGLGYLTGSTLETGELTPASIAAAVWNALLANHQSDGSAGKALGLASSGGVDYNALAAAVHQYTVEAGYSFEEMVRIMAAALAGTSSRAGSTITFKGVDGTTDRILGSFDAENNRTGAILDGG